MKFEKKLLLLLLAIIIGYWLASLSLYPWKLGFCYGGHTQSHVGKETKKIGCIIIIVTLWFGRSRFYSCFILKPGSRWVFWVCWGRAGGPERQRLKLQFFVFRVFLRCPGGLGDPV